MKPFRLGVFAALLFWPAFGWAFPQGKWNYVAEGGYDAHKKTIDVEIEKVAMTYNFLLRGIARSKLRSSNPVFGSIGIAYDGTTLTTSSDDKSLALDAKNGERIPWVTPDGRPIEVEQTIQGDVVKRVYYNDDGYRVVTYTLGPDQKSLTLEISLHSTHLKQPLKYRLRYLIQK